MTYTAFRLCLTGSLAFLLYLIILDDYTEQNKCHNVTVRKDGDKIEMPRKNVDF
jgi:hypothetical protein